MPTNRTPIRPGSHVKVTDRARALAARAKELAPQCTCIITEPSGFNTSWDCPACKKWWDLLFLINQELKLPPWQDAFRHPLDVPGDQIPPGVKLVKTDPHNYDNRPGMRELLEELGLFN
jgi:hypothetical protein